MKLEHVFQQVWGYPRNKWSAWELLLDSKGTISLTILILVGQIVKISFQVETIIQPSQATNSQQPKKRLEENYCPIHEDYSKSNWSSLKESIRISKKQCGFNEEFGNSNWVILYTTLIMKSQEVMSARWWWMRKVVHKNLTLRETTSWNTR